MTKQLDEVVTQLNHQQTAITTIKATLAYHQTIIDAQQNDIADIRVSINNIIHSLSDITAKLGFQITLPPPLPLSPMSPTPLPATATATAAGPTSPSFPLNATSPNSAPPALTLTPPTSPYTIGSDKAATTGNNPSTMLSNLARHVSFAEIKSATNEFYEVWLLGVGDLGKNSTMMFYKVLDARPAMNHTRLNEQKWTDERNMFVLLLEKKDKTVFEKALFVFDPGGVIATDEFLFNLEDKVDFMGTVMIR